MTRRAPLLTVLLVSLTVLLVVVQPNGPRRSATPQRAGRETGTSQVLTGNKEAEPSKVVHILWLDSPR